MRFYWVRYRIRQNNFHIFWEERNKTQRIMSQKHHPIWHHRTMRLRYVKPTQKDTENSKYRQTGTIRGCAGARNPRRNRKPDNSLKGIWNIIPRNLDNPRKGIRELVPNRILIQWPIGLTVST